MHGDATYTLLSLLGLHTFFQENSNSRYTDVHKCEQKYCAWPRYDFSWCGLPKGFYEQMSAVEQQCLLRDMPAMTSSSVMVQLATFAQGSTLKHIRYHRLVPMSHSEGLSNLQQVEFASSLSGAFPTPSPRVASNNLVLRLPSCLRASQSCKRHKEHQKTPAKSGFVD